MVDTDENVEVIDFQQDREILCPGHLSDFFSRNDLERGGEYIEDFNQLFERIR